jgi:hypothetical protein
MGQDPENGTGFTGTERGAEHAHIGTNIIAAVIRKTRFLIGARRRIVPPFHGSSNCGGL